VDNLQQSCDCCGIISTAIARTGHENLSIIDYSETWFIKHNEPRIKVLNKPYLCPECSRAIIYCSRCREKYIPTMEGYVLLMVGGTFLCPSCYRRNSHNRGYCSRCGHNVALRIFEKPHVLKLESHGMAHAYIGLCECCIDQHQKFCSICGAEHYSNTNLCYNCQHGTDVCAESCFGNTNMCHCCNNTGIKVTPLVTVLDGILNTVEWCDRCIGKYREFLHTCKECGDEVLLYTSFNERVPKHFLADTDYICHYCREMQDALPSCRKCGNPASRNVYWLLREGCLTVYHYCEACLKDGVNNGFFRRCECCMQYFSDNMKETIINGKKYVLCPECALSVDIHAQDSRVPGDNEQDTRRYRHRTYPALYRYTFKPKVKTRGIWSKRVLTFGMELEVRMIRYNGFGLIEKPVPDHIVERVHTMCNGFAYCKWDASIGESGFEIVTHPFTMEYYPIVADLFQRISEYLINEGFAVNPAGLGLHIHFSSSYLNDEELLNLIRFVYNPKNRDYLFHISGRKLAWDMREWASPDYYDGRIPLEEYSIMGALIMDRHSILNVGANGGKTHEIRMFASRLDVEFISDKLVWMQSLLNFCKSKHYEASYVAFKRYRRMEQGK